MSRWPSIGLFRCCGRSTRKPKSARVCAIQVVYPQSSRSEDVLAAENAEELMEFYLLDLSVRGEYPPYVASYLKSHGLYPQTLPGDAAVLKASTPDFIGINYYFSICAKVKEGPSTTTSRPSGCRTPSTSVIIPTCAKPGGWIRALTRWACILGCARSIIATVCP